MKKQSILLLSLIFLLTLVLLNCSKKKDEPTPGGGTTPPVALSVTSVSPATGSEGTKVVITGTGFSAKLATNKVKFGTTEAVLDSATATRLVTKVPKGATTGKVTVEVGGKTASSSADFTVSAATTPAAFSTVNTSSDITTETAKVSSTISANGGAAITQYGHVWSDTKADPTTADPKTEFGKTDGPFPLKFTSDLKSLKANTTYNVRAYATNDKGTSYGTALQVKTVQVSLDAPTLSLSQPEFVDVNTTAITFKGKIVQLNGFTIKEYGLYWSTTNQKPTVADQKLAVVKTVTQPLNFDNLQIRNLTPNTTFNVRAYAITTDNKTGYSETITAKTYENVTPVVTSGKVASVAETSIKLSGATASVAGNNPIYSYGYFYTTNKDALNGSAGLQSKNFNTTNVQLSVNFGEVEITSLLPNTTYYLAAYAYHRGTTPNPVKGEVLSVTTGGTSAVKIASVQRLTLTPSDVPFEKINGMTIAANGDLYVSNSNTLYQGSSRRFISRLPAGATQLQRIAGNMTGYIDGNAITAEFNGSTDLEFDGSNNLYVLESLPKRVRVIANPAGASPAVSTLKSGDLTSPNQLAFFPGVGMLIADKARVITVDANGNQTVFYTSPTNQTIFGLIADANYLYARTGSAYNSTIVQIDKNKNVKVLPGNLGISTGSSITMSGMAPSRDGKTLYILMRDAATREDLLGVFDLGTQQLNKVLLKGTRAALNSTFLRINPLNPKVLFIGDEFAIFKLTLE